jgi:hypothetical protein
LIIENQLADSDHSHLGQLLTYAAGTEAATIVWIATGFRDEHREALNWLNRLTDSSVHFFGVELEVVRIGESAAAPLFNVVVMPNDWSKLVKASGDSQTSAKSSIYRDFWRLWIEKCSLEKPEWGSAKTPPSSNWFSMRRGLPSGTRAVASFATKGRLRSEIYIDRRTDEESKNLFDLIRSSQTKFEEDFGGELSWERLDHKRACRIAIYRDGVVENAVDHEEYISWFFDSACRLRKALGRALT